MRVKAHPPSTTLHASNSFLFLKLFVFVYFPLRERHEHTAFEALLKLVPNLPEQLMVDSEEEVSHIAVMVTSSSSSFIDVC